MPRRKAVLRDLAALAVALAACPSLSEPGGESRLITSVLASEQPPTADDLLPAEVATVGWDALTNSPIVLLRELGSGRTVPIWVGLAEARAIALALHGIQSPRPMTHDLMTNLLVKLEAKLEEVQVHDLKDGTYYGWLKLRVAGRSEPLLIDTRPSDGLALALRTGATIRLARRVLDQTPDIDFSAPEASEQVVQIAGLTVVAASAELRKEFVLPERPGVVVIAATGEGAQAGLVRGDLIVAVNGAVPADPVALLKSFRDAPAAQPIRITFWRAGKESTVEMKPLPLTLPGDPARDIA